MGQHCYQVKVPVPTIPEKMDMEMCSSFFAWGLNGQFCFCPGNERTASFLLRNCRNITDTISSGKSPGIQEKSHYTRISYLQTLPQGLNMLPHMRKVRFPESTIRYILPGERSKDKG